MTLDASYRRILHRMGYYNYQQGLIFRHMNQEGGWNSHLQNCRNFIMKSIDFYKPSRVTVLGSGWLLDLPLKEMIDKTEEIILVDILHPPEVIDQVSGLPKVKLLEEDITGGLIKEVWTKSAKNFFLFKLPALKNITVQEYKPVDDPGLVISLNIFTQLESLPVDFIKKRVKINDDEINNLRKKIQSSHISFLTRYNSVLITDKSEIITDKTGNVTEVVSILTDLPPAKYQEEWTWEFDLKRSDYYTKRSVFKVVGLFLQTSFINISD